MLGLLIFSGSCPWPRGGAGGAGGVAGVVLVLVAGGCWLPAAGAGCGLLAGGCWWLLRFLVVVGRTRELPDAILAQGRGSFVFPPAHSLLRMRFGRMASSNLAASGRILRDLWKRLGFS